MKVSCHEKVDETGRRREEQRSEEKRGKEKRCVDFVAGTALGGRKCSKRATCASFVWSEEAQATSDATLFFAGSGRVRNRCGSHGRARFST